MKKLLCTMLFVFLLVGCTQKEATPQTLKIGLMPSYDSTPILWAYEEGLFEKAGVDVSFTVYANGQDRDTQVQTGAVDAVVTDIMGLVNTLESGTKVQALSQTDTVFSIVSSKTMKEKADIKLGMAEISVTQYAVDRGVDTYTVEKVFIDPIPQRLEMVGQGLIDGAILPEPMASMSKLKGLESTPIVVESPNVLMFTQSAITEKEEAIQKFYKAYNEGIETLNANPERVKDVLIKHLNLDASIKDVLVLPQFNTAKTISESVYSDVVTWMAETLNMNTSTSYKDAINTLIQ